MTPDPIYPTRPHISDPIYPRPRISPVHLLGMQQPDRERGERAHDPATHNRPLPLAGIRHFKPPRGRGADRRLSLRLGRPTHPWTVRADHELFERHALDYTAYSQLRERADRLMDHHVAKRLAATRLVDHTLRALSRPRETLVQRPTGGACRSSGISARSTNHLSESCTSPYACCSLHDHSSFFPHLLAIEVSEPLPFPRPVPGWVLIGSRASVALMARHARSGSASRMFPNDRPSTVPPPRP